MAACAAGKRPGRTGEGGDQGGSDTMCAPSLQRGSLCSIGPLFVLLTIIGVLTPTAASAADDFADGRRLYLDKAQCSYCHGWAADGAGEPQSNGGASNLRQSFLTREQLIEVIMCGRPGTPMPHYDEAAYTDKRCYGMTEAELGTSVPALPPLVRSAVVGRRGRNSLKARGRSRASGAGSGLLVFLVRSSEGGPWRAYCVAARHLHSQDIEQAGGALVCPFRDRADRSRITHAADQRSHRAERQRLRLDLRRREHDGLHERRRCLFEECPEPPRSRSFKPKQDDARDAEGRAPVRADRGDPRARAGARSHRRHHAAGTLYPARQLQLSARVRGSAAGVVFRLPPACCAERA